MSFDDALPQYSTEGKLVEQLQLTANSGSSQLKSNLVSALQMHLRMTGKG